MICIRSSKVLVEICTPIRHYFNMVLSELVIIQEEGMLDGWTGTATFTEVLSEDSGGKAVDNSSAVQNTGTASARQVSSNVSSDSFATESPLRQMLTKAGIGFT